ncbi:MAG: hypothetical protein E3J30_04495 [Anaerolineales bacterium]|nr:MAG: hypothetical protein E3J30_04495 [Anaerolineales bacterium]
MMYKKLLFTLGVAVATIAIWLVLFTAIELATQHRQPWIWIILAMLLAPLLAVRITVVLLRKTYLFPATLGGFLAAAVVALPWLVVTKFEVSVVGASLLLLLSWPLGAGAAAMYKSPTVNDVNV